jgi:hypothetical protein
MNADLVLHLKDNQVRSFTEFFERGFGTSGVNTNPEAVKGQMGPRLSRNVNCRGCYSWCRERYVR